MDWRQFKSTEHSKEVFWPDGESYDVIRFPMEGSIRFLMNFYLSGGKKIEVNATYEK